MAVIKVKNGNAWEVVPICHEYTYSTSEQRIGTWIDGKPLYRKVDTFSTTLSSATSYKIQGQSLSNIDTIVNNKCTVNWTDGSAKGVNPCPFYWSTTDYSRWYKSSAQPFIYYAGYAPAGTIIIQSVLEYTKTTD